MERIDRATGEVLGTLTDQKMGGPTYYPEASLDWSRVATVSAERRQRGHPGLAHAGAGGNAPALHQPDGAEPRRLAGRGRRVRAVHRRLRSCAGVRAGGRDGSQESRVINVATGQVVLDLGERVITKATFNPEGQFPAGRYLAVDDGNEFIEIYDMVDGRARHEPRLPRRLPIRHVVRPCGEVARRRHRWGPRLGARPGRRGRRYGARRRHALRPGDPPGGEPRSCPQRRRAPGHGRAERRAGQAVGPGVERAADRAPDRAKRFVSTRSSSAPTAATCSTTTGACCAATSSTPTSWSSWPRAA